MTTDTQFQKFLMLKGNGGTGKSVAVALIQHVIGNENTSSISLQDLNKRFYATGMYGKLLNACADSGVSGKDTQVENGKTAVVLRESRNARRNAEIERRNSADDSRTVRNAETQSVLTAEQRRLEEQKWVDEQERARAARKRNKRRSGPEL